MTVIDYAVPGPLTDMDSVPADLVVPDGDPVQICWPVHDLVIQPNDAEELGLPADRFATNQLRPAADIVSALLELDPAPLTTPREPDRRVIGTCRHFAVVGCALLRHHGVPARVRCGFATYFQPNQAVDHWIVEYRDVGSSNWVRVDVEMLGSDFDRGDALLPEDFLSGGEAWQAYRRGEIDASAYGVYGSENWGPAEIRGNAVKDLAALNKIEMLPWDEWGRMTEAYAGRTGPDYDELLDELAQVCAAGESSAVAAIYAHPDFTAPEALAR